MEPAFGIKFFSAILINFLNHHRGYLTHLISLIRTFSGSEIFLKMNTAEYSQLIYYHRKFLIGTLYLSNIIVCYVSLLL